MPYRRIVNTAALAFILAPLAAQSDTCAPVAPMPGTGAVLLCEHVLKLSCPRKNLEFTGFRTEIGGEVGIVTALHSVIDCPNGGIAEEKNNYLNELRVTRVDVARDVAFLSGRELGAVGLELAGGLSSERLRVVGYPFGAAGQSAIYLDLIHPRPWELANLGLPEDLRSALRKRKSPLLQTNVLSFVGELNRGHSGAPILSDEGIVVAVGNGGLKEADSDQVWAIPIWDLDWSSDVRGAVEQLAGKPTSGLAAYGKGITLPNLPPFLLVDAKDQAGPVYRHDKSGTSIAFSWGKGTIYSIATDGHDRIVFSNHNDNNIYEYKDGRVQVIHTHSTYSRDVNFDQQGRLYFSESSGAGGNGRIYRLWEGRVNLQLDVELNDVDGYWAGSFAFAPDNTIWLSSGNTRPAYLYEVRQGRPQVRHVASNPITGFAFLDEDTIAYTDWRQEARTLHLPTMTEGDGKGEVVRLGTATWLSDVAIAPGNNANGEVRNVPLIGHLVVLNSSSIRSLNDISSNSRLCGNSDIFERARAANPALGSVLFSRVTSSEAYSVLTTGACSGLFVKDFDRFKAAMGREANNFHGIPIRGL